jgi:hypothetical protein
VHRRRSLLVMCVGLLLAALAFSACGDDSRDGATITPQQPQAATEIASFDGVHSGEMGSELVIWNRTAEKRVAMRFAGNFQRLGEEVPPQLHLALSSQGTLGGRSIDFNGSLFLLPKRAAVVYGPSFGEVPYKVSTNTFERMKTLFREAQAENGKGGFTACLNAAGDMNIADLIRNPSSEGASEESDGVRVYEISGEVNALGLVADLVHLTEDTHCEAQMRALGLPSATQLRAVKMEMRGAVRTSQITLGLDRQGVVHKFFSKIEFKNQKGDLIDYELTFWLENVNKGQEIVASPRGRPLDALLRKFGASEEAALRAGPAEAVISFLEGVGGGMTGRLPKTSPGR